MAQTSLPWGGTSTGDAGPYTDDQWSDVWRRILTRDRALEGVLPDYLSELAVGNPSGLTIRVVSGGAIVDGKFYANSANVDFAGVAPGGGSNFYTVVLDKDFTAQTVRLNMLGPNVVSPPAVTQSDGVTWEIAIATVEITSGSAVTITDVRAYCHYNTEISSAMIPTDAITTAKILDGAVTAVKMTDGIGSGVDADLLDGLEGSAYTNSLVEMSGTSDITLTSTPVLMPGLTTSLGAGTYLITCQVELVMSGTSGQFATMRGRLHKAGVQQGNLVTWQLDVPASARNVVLPLKGRWRIVVPSTQTIQILLDAVAGFTASVTTVWQSSDAWALKVST